MVLSIPEQGANEGTSCSMIRNVLDPKRPLLFHYFTHSVSGLVPLIGINAVITDENPVGSYGNNLKSAITGDFDN